MRPVRLVVLASSHKYDIDDFFVGIGDINSSFLPKVDPSSALMGGKPPTSSLPASVSDNDPSIPSSPASSSTAVEETDTDEPSKTRMLEENSAVLEAQVETRQLAKMQEQLQDSATSETKPENGTSNEVADTSKPVRKALLRNDDIELTRVKKASLLAHLLLSVSSWSPSLAPR